ncbi:hypothetical protein FJZ27_04100 [Candidatus Peribacteria bacterium]|nr:hypothetical protein [Candidatus Peribacteria bacterium]
MPRIPSAIIGHESPIEALRADIASGNVAHAYLFHGPAHLGKMTTALWFAEKLLCAGLDEERRKQSVQEIEHLTHPDLFIIDQLWMEDVCEDWDVIARSSNIPQEHRQKAGAKSDMISIDDIRALHGRLHEKGLSPYRCCIIRSVDRMQDLASNVLLKILEEPPEGLVFILTADSADALLPTIVSRARSMHFHRVADHALQPLLGDVSEDDQGFILGLAQGAPGLLFALRNDPDALRAHRAQHNAALAFWNGRTLADRLQSITPLFKRGEEAGRLLLHLALVLRLKPDHCVPEVQAFTALVEGLQTNAHRQILAQRFALDSLAV